jgi:2-polyprenyl-6-methoxyphenol hydroxylase-like FAD-dependent oxidoreductase
MAAMSNSSSSSVASFSCGRDPIAPAFFSTLIAMPSSASRRAIVIGGSVGGLFAATALRADGWQVDVYERHRDELAERGAGIMTHAPLIAALHRAGAASDQVGIPIFRRVALDRAGAVVSELAVSQVVTAWGRVFRLLRDALPDASYHAGFNLVGVSEDATAVRAHFADGSMLSADLLVAADGIRSAVREQFLPHLRTNYAGYIAWRGLVDENLLSRECHARLGAVLAISAMPREQILGYPVAGQDHSTAPGRRRYNFVWYRSVEPGAALDDLNTDANGTRHEAIPPPMVRADVIAKMRADASERLAPEFVEIAQRTRQPFFQPIYDLASPRINFGRIALLGDAAFVARPHCGMGVTKAAEDATVLAASLRQQTGVAEALARYNALRQPAGQRLVDHGRALGAALQDRHDSPEDCAAAARYSQSPVLLHEVAVRPAWCDDYL